jgi:SAM-dependent methyltransferase
MATMEDPNWEGRRTMPGLTTFAVKVRGRLGRLKRRAERRWAGAVVAGELPLWSVERRAHYRGRLFMDGWIFHNHHDVTSLAIRLPNGEVIEAEGYGQESLEVAALHGDRATNCRFSLSVTIEDAEDARQSTLICRLKGAMPVVLDNLDRNLLADPFHQVWPHFHELVRAKQSPKVLEIGSRARSGNVNVEWLPDDASYVGFDVLDGPNVDVVGDAHRLASYFPDASVDAIYSVSTIEHLAMPWKAVLEMNAILKPGGLVFAATHQTWPVHDDPWDFWRFSSYTWKVLFNTASGFEIVEVAMGERASVVADFLTPAAMKMDLQPAFLGSAVIARKVSGTDLRWDVDPDLFAEAEYPG